MNSMHAGIGMTSARTRGRMIERLRSQGIQDETVLAAMFEVPRHLFVDEAMATRAYDDVSLPIGHYQTISQPYIVARMTEILRNGKQLGRVLEVGTDVAIKRLCCRTWRKKSIPSNVSSRCSPRLRNNYSI